MGSSGNSRRARASSAPPWWAGGALTVTITGSYLINLEREGLRFFGGDTGGDFHETFTFSLTDAAPGALPLPAPVAPGDDAGVWEMSRLAAPLPPILPSYNQIGFDSLHRLIGLVEPMLGGAVGWVVGARLADDENRTEVDPGTGALFPVEISYGDGLVTMVNADGLTLEVMNAAIPMDTYPATVDTLTIS